MRARSGATFDTANVVWLTDQYWQANAELGATSSGLDLRTRVPRIPARDTSRVLARVRGVPCTAGHVIQAYRDIPPVGRRKIVTVVAMFDFVQRIVLEPDIVASAREQGLDHDPGFMKQVAGRREGLLVEHMYEDSVQARLQVTDDMRRQYYQDHKSEFVTRERVRYAVILRATEAGADSVVRRLDGGEPAVSIVVADSLSGLRGDFIKDLLEGENHMFYNVLFQELRPHQSTKFFLSKDGVWAVFHVLSHDTSRPMAYDEVRDIVDQSVENVESERSLNLLLRRWRQRYSVESHPEWVMRINLTVPADD
jgi:hypothetical protein